MRIMIIDDEYSYSEKLYKNLSIELCKDFDNIIYDLYHHPKDIDYTIEYDLAFIDIDLPDKNGIMIAEEMKKHYPKTKIVFISSHTSLVHNTLIVNPFYFIRKSHYDDDLKVLYRLIKERITKEERIELKFNNEIKTILIKDIVYIEAVSHKLKVYTKKQIIYDNRTLSQMLTHLAKHSFARIHRSFIINIDYMTKMKGDMIELNGNVELNIGRHYKEEFMNIYEEVLLG